MFVELLFCITFFLLPIVGMFGAILIRGKKAPEADEGRVLPVMMKRRRSRKVYPEPTLVNNKVMQYQLIESRIHKPLVLTRFKEEIHQRAGP